MRITKPKAALVAAGIGAASLAGVATATSASAYNGYTVYNSCAGAAQNVWMLNIYGGWDGVPCGHTYTQIAEVRLDTGAFLHINSSRCYGPEYGNTVHGIYTNSTVWTTRGHC